MNKKGQVGSSVITMYRVLVIIIISVVILGVSSFVYSHHINVRDSEAMILVREVVECVIDSGVVDLDKLKVIENVFEYCGFGEEMEPYFVSVKVLIDGKIVLNVDGGDASLLWVNEVFSGNANTEAIEEYEPGHHVEKYSVVILDGKVKKDGHVIVEVVVNEE